MAKNPNKKGIRDIENEYKEANKQAERLQQLQELELSGLEKIFGFREKILNSQSKYALEQEKLKNMVQGFQKLQESGAKFEKRTVDALKKRVSAQQQSVKVAQKQLALQQALQKSASDFLKMSGSATKSMWKFLMDSDKAIKSTALELGLSGERSEVFRENIEAAASHAARLGASVEDLTKAASTYAAETGRVKNLTEATYDAITRIGKGTDLGIEQAAQLAGQYDLMGVNATKAAQQVQDIVDTTERMGVNTGKVLKKVNDNFKRLQKYTFQQGVKGFAEMASYAEKFKVDMNETLNAADKARTLEGAVELAAELQVMGGEFAKSDPFQLLFLSRNDPAAFTKKINEMTKGVVTFKKQADGTIEKFIAPQDIDRLNKVGEALGMQSGELVEQALRMADIQKMRHQMMGSGLSTKDMELVEGIAEMSDNGTFTVKVGKEVKAISDLTRNDIKALETQKKSLEERAKASQTVEDAFRNTILELKTSLLPILKTINGVLETVRPIADKFLDWFDSLNGWGKIGMAVAGALTLAGASLLKAFLQAKVMNSFGGSGIGGLGKGAAASGGGMLSGSQMLGQGKGAMAAGKGAGLSALGKGAGAGLAAVGVGGGIAIAAKGIGSLAESLSKLDEKQLATLEKISLGLGIALPAMAVGMVLVGKAAEASVIGIGILTLAVLGIGAGIGMATAGIGAMAEGLSTLMDTANPTDLLKMAGGMTALAGASVLFANPLSMVGLAGMSASVLAMAKAGPGMDQVGSAFEKIGVVLQGSSSQLKEVKDTIQAISSTEVGSNSAIANLANLLSKPLKVEFADKEVGFVAKIDVNMDGQKMFDTMNIARKVEIKQIMYREGRSAPRGT